MNDKTVAVLAKALETRRGTTLDWAEHIIATLKTEGIALVELQSINGLRFTHEDGTPYTPDELRYFAGEALAAAEFCDG